MPDGRREQPPQPHAPWRKATEPYAFLLERRANVNFAPGKTELELDFYSNLCVRFSPNPITVPSLCQMDRGNSRRSSMHLEEKLPSLMRFCWSDVAMPILLGVRQSLSSTFITTWPFLISFCCTAAVDGEIERGDPEGRSHVIQWFFSSIFGQSNPLYEHFHLTFDHPCNFIGTASQKAVEVGMSGSHE